MRPNTATDDRLIAAAPALLAALKLAHLHMAETEGLLQHCEAWGDDEQDVLEQIRNAIKQAEGRD